MFKSQDSLWQLNPMYFAIDAATYMILLVYFSPHLIFKQMTN